MEKIIIKSIIYNDLNQVKKNFAMDYIKSLYFRPYEYMTDKIFNEYFEDYEKPRTKLIDVLINKLEQNNIFISAVTFHYSLMSNKLSYNYEWLCIIDFDIKDSSQFLKDIVEKEDYINWFDDALGNSECQNSFNLIGQDAIKLVINESF